MRRWTLAATAAVLFAAGLWHLPAIAQRAAAPAFAEPAVTSAAATAGKPAAAPADGGTAAPELISFDEYRDFRTRYIAQSQGRLARQLAEGNLPAAQRADLERRKAYYDRQAAMPSAERDALFHARFDLIDTDHDGTLDSAERTAWREKQRAHYRELAAERAQQPAAQQ